VTEQLLEVKDLHISYKVYEGLLRVLNGVSLSVGEKEKVGIIGESGCGKTTTMKAIMRILAPNAIVAGGTIAYKGADVLQLGRQELMRLHRTTMSMIFQDPTAALNPVFKVGEQLEDIVRYSEWTSNAPSKQEVRTRAVELLKNAALPEPERILDSYPFQLSGGMRQRVCIAMSLASAKDLLIADEPGTSLDVTIEDQIMRLLKQIVEERGLSVILISHSIGAVKGFVTKLYVMYAGMMVEEGPTEELFSNPVHPYTQNLLKAVPKLTGGGVPEGIAGRIPSYLTITDACRFGSRCRFAKEHCHTNAPPAFDIGNGHRVACFAYGGS
jgi:peptide/nickel transport system ATP-binding protein